MAFDTVETKCPGARQRIAVIGSGVSGLSAAWLLSRRHEVVLYEKEGRLGGHSNTVDVETSMGVVPVDTGFIVFNEPSYPNLTALFQHLDVKTDYSCMSFGASLRDGRVEYSGQTLSSVFARRLNAVSPRFLRMLTEIPRFHRDAKKALREDYCERATLGDFIAERGYSTGFCDLFLKPMTAAIWSTPTIRVFDYPALSFFRFFENHGLLRVLNLPEWRTVAGGSRSYVQKLREAFAGEVRSNAAVAEISTFDGGVRVIDVAGHTDQFDQVVIACHGDEALKLRSQAPEDERAILGAFDYQVNHAVLHLDPSMMPQRRRAWSSWNYLEGDDAPAVTYWMNRLQNLPCKEDIFVTLNPPRAVRPGAEIASFSYDHPMFNAATQRAQGAIWDIQGRGGVWYAGAHLGHGFHEDGLQSGLAVAEAIGGVRRPWSVEDESGRLQLRTQSVAA